jgi:hypothetical protein
MSAEAKIIESIRKIAGISDLSTSLLAYVVSVDESEMTCEVRPITGDANYKDVRLMADADNTSTGMYFKPKVDSVVMISPQDEVTYFVSMYSEVDEVWLRGVDNGGVPITENIVEKLNNLENKVNTIITTFNSHTHAGVTVGAGVTGASATPIVGTLTPTVDAEIESTTVKHG